MRASNSISVLMNTARGAAVSLGAAWALSAQAATPGIAGPTFNLTAGDMQVAQPDGRSLYSWGYGCDPTQPTPTFLPAKVPGAFCLPAQLPGPTLIVTEGDSVTVNLTNNLPAAAGATSILFPGFNVSTSGGQTGLLTQEAPSAAYCAVNSCSNTVTYKFTASSPGTHAYYSGTQGDLQVEMGLYGAIIVLPKTVPANCTSGLAAKNLVAESTWGESDFRLTQAAYDHPATCYDREYLFQFSEADVDIHNAAQQQVIADKAKPAGQGCSAANGCLVVPTEPYVPGYFMINGRSMPDDMDPNYSAQYPTQPYNGNPHMHPGELTLLRIIGQGRWQHPFHEHANHVRILARDGNLLLDPTGNALAGPLLFTTTTTPGLTMDGIFYWTGKGLNWDVFGHGYSGDASTCVPDANGYNTSDPTAPNYFEWCGDHNKALEKYPAGQVGSNGPVTLPDANIVTNGVWYGGSPYLGSDANSRAVGPTPLPPAGTVGNPAGEQGFAFMWHSHNEREITTNNVFPGGMMMMMLVDPRGFVINESN
jgi:FtsP/CotA-like multicopper oxidase with cupredoxin domain